MGGEVFENSAFRLDTLPGHVGKDFRIRFVLDALYRRLPDGHPRLLFKGGTSLSKAFGVIRRFSEDIDLVVHRGELGLTGDRDPIIADGLSNRKRNALFKELAQVCGGYVLGELHAALSVLQLRSFRVAFSSRRCPIPTEGMPERKREGAVRRPKPMKNSGQFSCVGLRERRSALVA